MRTLPAGRQSGGRGLEDKSGIDNTRLLSEPPAAAQGRVALPITVSKFWRGRHRRESVHVRLGEFKGYVLLDIRTFQTGPDGIDRPCKRGIAMSVRRLPELLKALHQAEKTAVHLGVLEVS